MKAPEGLVMVTWFVVELRPSGVTPQQRPPLTLGLQRKSRAATESLHTSRRAALFPRMQD